MFIKRDITTEIKKLSQEYPIITLTGPRQSGKTTLVKNIFPHKPYVSLENPDIRNIAISDPRYFLGKLS